MVQSTATESVFLVAVMTLTGLGLVWLGLYVRHTQDLTLVAGVRGGETVTDPAALTTLVGRVTVVTGVVTLLVGLLSLLFPSPERGLLWGSYVVAVLALAGWAHWRSREYTVTDAR